MGRRIPPQLGLLWMDGQTDGWMDGWRCDGCGGWVGSLPPPPSSSSAQPFLLPSPESSSRSSRGSSPTRPFPAHSTRSHGEWRHCLPSAGTHTPVSTSKQQRAQEQQYAAWEPYFPAAPGGGVRPRWEAGAVQGCLLSTLRPRCIHTASTLHAHCMHPHCTHTAPTLHPYCIHIACTHSTSTLHPHCTHTVSTLHPHCTHTASILHPRCIHVA